MTQDRQPPGRDVEDLEITAEPAGRGPAAGPVRGAPQAAPDRPGHGGEPSAPPDPWRGPSIRTGRTDADVIESGPRRHWPLGRYWPPRRVRLAGFVLAVVLAAAAGYLAGSRHAPAGTPVSRPPAPLPLTSLPLPAGAQPLTWTGARCAVQVGRALQLGLEILNRSADAVTLLGLSPVLPMGGLRPAGSAWGGCGQLAPTPINQHMVVPAGGTTWLTITFETPTCPGPYPVFFTVDYAQDGRTAQADVRGFNDLGDVPYVGAGCPTR